MATIRFIREDLEVQCNPGENLRELVMKENLQLYGLKGILGNCGGAGQCSTCFISVEGGGTTYETLTYNSVTEGDSVV